MIDVTNTAAVQWFGERLRRFGAEFGVDSFQFDAGEVDYLPPRWRTAVPLNNANYYTTLYVHMAASFGRMVEVTRLATTSRQYTAFWAIPEFDLFIMPPSLRVGGIKR